MKNKATLLLLLLLMAVPVWSKVNINDASASEIASSLKWIGEKKAQAIVNYRKKHGDFCSVDDLLKVKDIGSREVEHNRTILLFGSANDKKNTENCETLPASSMNQ